MRLLDRYLLAQWFRIFLLTAIGFPMVQLLIELTDTLNRMLERQLTPRDIVLSSLYGLPDAVALMMPAAALFATVFTVGPFSRHSELTAAKASGRSFHRLMVPLFLASAVAAGLAYFIGEVATEAKTRQLEIRKERQSRFITTRVNFVYRADSGWIYTIRTLDTEQRRIEQAILEHASRLPGVPTIAILADSAAFRDSTGWRLWNGAMHVVGDSGTNATFHFQSARLKAFDESPRDLLIEPRDPDEMAYAELGRYIETLTRSGSDTRKLKVERALKIALPATCLVIALFAAPLAVTSPRAGPAVGVAVGLGTTVAYLLLINLSKAFGNGGVIDPTLAAWAPNGLFLLLALVLLSRART